MLKTLRSIIVDEQGVSLAEYGLLLALIAVVCIGAVTALGTNISAKLNAAATAI